MNGNSIPAGNDNLTDNMGGYEQRRGFAGKSREAAKKARSQERQRQTGSAAARDRKAWRASLAVR